MIYASIYVDGICIEIHNSLLGKETIKVNGEIVSSHYSIFGTKHIFKYDGADYELTLRMSIHGIVFDLFKNNNPIVQSAKGGCLIVFGVAALLAILMGLILSRL